MAIRSRCWPLLGWRLLCLPGSWDRMGNTLKLSVRDPNGTGPTARRVVDAIAFRLGAWAGQLPRRIDLAYTVEVNEYNGERRLQLNVKDIRPAAEQR